MHNLFKLFITFAIFYLHPLTGIYINLKNNKFEDTKNQRYKKVSYHHRNKIK